MWWRNHQHCMIIFPPHTVANPQKHRTMHCYICSGHYQNPCWNLRSAEAQDHHKLHSLHPTLNAQHLHNADNRVPPSFLSRAAHSLESVSRDNWISHFIYQRWVSSSTTTSVTSLPDAKPSKFIPKGYNHNVSTANVSTEQHFAWSQLQQRERQWQRAYQRRPTPLETQEKKRQRQKHTHHWQQFTRAQFQAVKFGCEPIKLELRLLVHTHTANCVRVHFWHLGVYKESRVA